MTRACRVIVCAFAVLLWGFPPIAAHPDGQMQMPAARPPVDHDTPLFSRALGPFTRPISSVAPEVQAYFDQGMQMMYAFDTALAGESFREAEKRDPACAMCFWGDAWSWGAYLNAPMPPDQEPMAYAAIQRAVTLAPAHASPVERALIDAMATRYAAVYNPSTRRAQDEAYANAMRGVYERFSGDLDVATLYAESLFLLEPRRGARDITSPNVVRILAVLEGTLANGVKHVGACHLLIHLTEATSDPGRAEACADYIGNAIPGASHINHMPSHTWNGIGRWGDSVRANLEAWHSDQKAAVGEGFAIYPTHNLHMLAFAASMDGQGAIAIQAGKDYEKITHDSMFRVLTLVRFGRFDEVLEITRRPPDDTVSMGVWEFGQGYARLRAGDAPAVAAHLAQLKVAASSNAIFRFHSAHDLLGTLAALLEGEMQRATGDLDAAIASFERAVALQDAMIYDEPEPLPFAARHWLGAALLDASRDADAERVYRQDLVKHPKNGWALFGLKAALNGQHKPAADVAADFTASWARSDMWIRRSSPP
ncbi:MAG: hypothetical protein ABI634_09980 [Acidobacteriota bacterium]